MDKLRAEAARLRATGQKYEPTLTLDDLEKAWGALQPPPGEYVYHTTKKALRRDLVAVFGEGAGSKAFDAAVASGHIRGFRIVWDDGIPL